MSDLNNSNPPIRTEIIKNRKASESACYVIKRTLQYNPETRTDSVLESRILGVLLNEDDDISLMIPIDEWKEEENQRLDEVRLAKQGKRQFKTISYTERKVYNPLHFFVFMLDACCAKYSECEVASVFLDAQEETFASVYPDLGGLGLSEELVRHFFVLLGKDSNGGLLHDFSRMDIEKTGKDVRIRCQDPVPYALNVHESANATILAMDIVARKVTPRKDAALIDAFLKKITVRGTIVCTDAQYASALFVQNVLNDGGDYLVRITDSTPAVQEEIAALFRGEEPNDSLYSAQKERNGRTETYAVSLLPGVLLDPALKKKWIGTDDGLIARVTIKSDAREGETAPEEVFYLVSSLPFAEDLSAYAVLSALREPLAVPGSHRLVDIVCLHDGAHYKNGEYLKGRMLFEEPLQAFIQVAKPYVAKHMGWAGTRLELQALSTCSERFLQLYNGIMKNKK